MDFGINSTSPESPCGEGYARPLFAELDPAEFDATSPTQRDSRAASVLARLAESFGITDSGVGTTALLAEIRKDFITLRKVFAVPDWSDALEALRIDAATKLGADPVRDLGSLRSQPKSPLKDFLSPLSAKLAPDLQRAVRSVRGLVTLKLLSGREQLPSALGDEIRRWLDGRLPAGLRFQDIQPSRLCEMRNSCPIDSPTARLLTFAISALESTLKDPFASTNQSSSIVAIVTDSPLQEEPDDPVEDEDSLSSDESSRDPLRGFLAEAGIAGVRVFSAVPTFDCVLPAELELIVPRILKYWHTAQRDEAIAALITLFTRVLPSAFPRVPLSAQDGAGIWIDVEAGLLCWNLDEVIASHMSPAGFPRQAHQRYVRIPLPAELTHELRRRVATVAKPQSLACLFSRDLNDLGKSTKKMLRQIALSSHRPSLTRLSRTWGRFILQRCDDEAYASAIGVDFTIGTSANFNYVRLRAGRLTAILHDTYERIGLSGRFEVENVPDVGSLWVPDLIQAGAFVKSALHEINELIRRLPKRTTKKKLMATHNAIAIRIYAVIKLLVGGRELVEETMTRFRIDPATGLVVLTDKRTAPYHQRRIVSLAPTLRDWLNAYFSWLKLVSYRLADDDRALSTAIATVLDVSIDGDHHPLFFRFTDEGKTLPLGTGDIKPGYAEYGIKVNGGRHFLDWLCRDANLDSAAIMHLMGRGNPGQEASGSWSAAVPIDAMKACSDIIEDWLGTLALPSPPELTPRPLARPRSKKRLPAYVPKLLKAIPDWGPATSFGPAEPCPFADGTVMLASCFEDLFREWRRHAPPEKWLGVSLSLILEDGVIHQDELYGVLQALSSGTVYRHDQEHFVDCRPTPLGIRRTWLSQTTMRLLEQISPDEVVSLEALSASADQFLASAIPDARGRGLKFILASASAYYSLRVPGVLFGWMRGFRFARTSRPETVARHRLMSIEHPKFDARRRHRYPRGVDAINRALRKAIRKTDNGSSHANAIDWLHRYLKQIAADFEHLSHEALICGYLIHLCKTQINIHSIERYESGARAFLRKSADSIGESGFNQVNWQGLVASCLVGDDGSTDESPASTAINHALTWLGIDVRAYRRAGPPPASFQYAERPSANEIAVAIELLSAKKVIVGDDWSCAATALKLLAVQAHRWDGIAHLRLCDLVLDVERPHLIITKEAGGKLKSGNAPRVLLLDDVTLAADLRAICAQRAARFPGDPFVQIFGDHDDPRTNGTADRVHALIGQALWHATGSPVIRPHDPRDTVITRRMDELLNPDNPRRGTLFARQGMFDIAVQAGQSSPAVAMENYAHDFELHRRRWVTKVNAAIRCAPSHEFLAKLMGIPAATLRKRVSRRGNVSLDSDANCCSTQPLRTGARIVDLSSLVVQDKKHIVWNEEAVADETTINTASFVGFRCLGESASLARLASRLSEPVARSLDAHIAKLNRRRAVELKAREDVNRETFTEAILSTGLPIAMRAIAPPFTAANRLVTSMSCLGDPWEFANPEDIVDIEPWISIWKANGIGTEVILKPGNCSAVDAHLKDRLKTIGVQRARGLPERHFRRGVRAVLRFVPARNGTAPGNARASPQLAFLVSVCALAFLISTKEAVHEQEIETTH